MPFADEKRDPMPAIAKGLVNLKKSDEVLLLKHPFDPIPLRDMLVRKGFSSWAEERKAGEWFIYFITRWHWQKPRRIIRSTTKPLPEMLPRLRNCKKSLSICPVRLIG